MNGIQVRTSQWPVLLLGLSAIAVGVVAYALVGAPTTTKAAQRVVTAQRGVIQSTVSATGTVSAPQSIGLSFQTGGKLVSLQVAPGDQVHAGEVLAEVEPTNARQAVQSAEINLRSAQAKLRQTEEVLSPQQASANQVAVRQSRDSVKVAQRSLHETRAAASLDTRTQTLAVSQAHAALINAQQAATIDATSQQDTVNQTNVQLATDQAQLISDQSKLTSDPTQQQSADQNQVNADQGKLQSDANSITMAKNNQASAAVKDQQSIAQAQNALANAEQNAKSAKLKEDLSIAQAQSSLTSAKDMLQSTIAGNAVKSAPPLAGVLEGAQTGVQSAQLSLDSARLTLEQTKLIAPSIGVVASVGGAVGEQVSGGSGGGGSSSSTSSASGSSGANSGGTSSGGSGSSSTSGSSSSSGSGFITLTNLHGLQVTAGFSEADAVKLRLGQSANVTVNALPGQELAAHVISIPPTGTTSSGVVMFNVVLQLDQSATGVRPGMSVSAQVVVSQVENAVNLPPSAITRRSGGQVVTLMRAGKQIQVPVVTGVTGDSSVQILNGVSVGDQIVITSTIATGTGAITGTGSGGLGGRGGGLGGLGGGGGFTGAGAAGRLG